MKRIKIIRESNCTSAVFMGIVTLMIMQGLLIPAYGQWNQHLIDMDMNWAFSVYSIDMDRDDDLDVVASGIYANTIAWYEAPLWTKHIIDNKLNWASDFYVVDMDGDNDLDVVGTSESHDDVIWYEAPLWSKHFIDDNLDGARDVQVADMDGDSDLDVIAVGELADDIVWYEAPSWNRHMIDDNLSGARHVSIADMDNDDTLDVVATGVNANAVVWYEAPKWTKHFIDRNLYGAIGLYVIDMDGNDTLDVVAVGTDANDVVWYKGLSWGKYIIDDNMYGARDVQVTDMDGDNDLDVVVTSFLDGVVWYEAPSWIKHYIDENLIDSRQLYVIDFDHDNDVDVLATSSELNVVAWYENLGINTAFGKTMEINPRYVSTQGDTVKVNAQLENPKNHPVSVYAHVQGSESTFQDSIELYDDGLHGDGNTDDNMWSGNKWFSGLEEDLFIVKLLTHDLTEGTTHCFFPASQFTTIGPVVYISHSFYKSDTEPNPGDAIRMYITLTNEGSIATATHLRVELSCPDTRVEFTVDGRDYNDIEPGEMVQNKYTYSFNIPEDWPVNTEIPMTLHISSHGTEVWTDSFSVMVLPPSTSIQTANASVPEQFALYQNHPNPFNPSTTIRFDLPEPSEVALKVFTLLGEEVETIVRRRISAGEHVIQWNAGNQPSGIYLIRLEAEGFVHSRKMILMK
jgi:hypothetical protein